MMLGLRERFPYFACDLCGCTQIGEMPDDLARFYPSDYYSFLPPKPGRLRSLISTIAAIRDRAEIETGAVRALGQAIAAIKPNRLVHLLRGVPRDGRILDVGCGHGRALAALSRAGYKNLAGADPFLPSQELAPGIRLIKSDIFGINEGDWDAILMLHSLEHMPRQRETLARAASLLSSRGILVVGVPLIDSAAAERYSDSWVGYDAPRHLFLHTKCSLELAAAKANLTLDSIHYDSTIRQFWASDLYTRGIPLHPIWFSRERSVALLWHFGPIRVLNLHIKARRLNKTERGDQAIFRFRRAPVPQAYTRARHGDR